MNDSFETLVRDSITWLTAGAEVPADLVDRARQNVRARRRRRIVLRAAGAGLASTVAAVAVVAALIPSGPPRRTGAITAQTTAQVIGKVQQALTAISRTDPIMVTKARADVPIWFLDRYQAPVGEIDAWYRNGVNHVAEFGPGGRLIASTRTVVGSHRNLEVNYAHRTWWDFGPTDWAIANSGCHLQFGDIGATAWAAGIRKLLSCAHATVAGRLWVNGVHAIALRLNFRPGHGWPLFCMPPVCGWPISGFRAYLFIDPSSYLPILVAPSVVFTSRTITPPGRQYVEFRWLAPTPANLARLRLAIPPGFRHLKFRRSGPR
jgi:hypothetical protein